MRKGYSIGYRIGLGYKSVHKLIQALFVKIGLSKQLGTLSFILMQITLVFFFYQEIILGALFAISIAFLIALAGLFLEAHKYPYYVSIVQKYEKDKEV